MQSPANDAMRLSSEDLGQLIDSLGPPVATGGDEDRLAQVYPKVSVRSWHRDPNGPLGTKDNEYFLTNSSAFYADVSLFDVGTHAPALDAPDVPLQVSLVFVP